MKVIGIDQSLNGTGICVIENGVLIVTHTITHKHLKGVEKLAHIKRNIQVILDMEKPDLAAMEDYAYSRFGFTFKLGEVGGVVKLLLYENKIPLKIFGIKTIKKFATGNGNAKKEDMVIAAKAITHREEFNDHNLA